MFRRITLFAAAFSLLILAAAVLAWRGAAQLERARVHAMLGTYIASPYRPLPNGGLTKRLGVWRLLTGAAFC